jgi:mRNA interferase RelE/StbE
MAWQIELSEGAVKNLKQLDHQHARRILSFLHGRVAQLDDPRSIGEALKGSKLGSFGSTALVTTASSLTSRTV